MEGRVDIWILMSLQVISTMAVKREITTCPGATGITGGCVEGRIIKLKTLIQGANAREPANSCGTIGLNDCEDRRQTFQFYRFIGYNPSKIDETATVPNFSSKCYDPVVNKNKYIKLTYECIPVANIAQVGESKNFTSAPGEKHILNDMYPRNTIRNVGNYECDIYGPSTRRAMVVITLIRSHVDNGHKDILIQDTNTGKQCTIPLNSTYESNLGKEIYRGKYPVKLFLNSSYTNPYMMWLSVKDADGGLITVRCLSDVPQPTKLTEVCLQPMTTKPSTVTSTSSPVPKKTTSQKSTTMKITSTATLNTTSKTKVKTIPTATRLVDSSKQPTLEVSYSDAQSTTNNATDRSESMSIDAEGTTLPVGTTDSVTTDNATLRVMLTKQSSPLNIGLIIGPVVAVVFIVIPGLVLFIIILIKRRRGKNPKLNDNNNTIELDSANTTRLEGDPYSAPTVGNDHSNKTTEYDIHVYGNTNVSTASLSSKEISADGNYQNVFIDVEQNKQSNSRNTFDGTKPNDTNQHKDSHEIGNTKTEVDNNQRKQIATIMPTTERPLKPRTQNDNLYLLEKKPDFKSNQMKTSDEQAMQEENPIVPEKAWGDQLYSDITLNRNDIGEPIRKSKMTDNDIYDYTAGTFPNNLSIGSNTEKENIQLMIDKAMPVRVSQMIENEIYNQ